jgi:glycogen(starch) synthase
MRNCVDVDRIRELVSSRTQKTNDAPIVLFVGRLEVRKGIDIAIRSFRDILRSHPKAQLHLAGSFGSEHNEARFEEAMATLSVKERSAIRLLGHLGANDTIEAMASADIVIAPSRWEAFGNVALEAKAAGTPLVATSGSGFADYCISGYDSVLVKPGNHEELTNAVVKLIDDKHLCKALANNASRSIDKFSASSVAADLDQILAGSLQHVEKVKR